MSAARVIVVGSGPGASTAAMALAEAGHDVTILEKGRSYFGDLTSKAPATLFSNDELKDNRGFSEPPVAAEPREFRDAPSVPDSASFVGEVQSLPQVVGGGAVHWDAKTPRFWDIDFQKHTLLGPQPDASVTDWPFTYDEIAPYYDEIERLIGVQGDLSELPELVLRHAPRSNDYPMPKGPPQYSSLVASRGAAKVGLHPFPSPMAINSVEYDGRPPCCNCGFCTDFGCPTQARIGALAPLRRALLAGAELRDRSRVVSVAHDGSGRASGVRWMDETGAIHSERADAVVLGANGIESSRLAALSGFPDPHDVLGRFLMFHWFTDASGIYFGERLHNYRGRDHTHEVDDFADPDFPGARAAARAAGLPYFRGGKVEMGGGERPLAEAAEYQQILQVLKPDRPFGAEFKELMRTSLLRDRLCGLTFMGEDLPYATNRVDLSPTVRDWRGFPVARITYGPGTHELAAQAFYIPWLERLLRASGADVTAVIPAVPSSRFPIGDSAIPATDHIMGGMRMGRDARSSVTDHEARHHQLSNVFVADGAAFPTSGGHNPTLTIMATSLRNSRRWASAL